MNVHAQTTPDNDAAEYRQMLQDAVRRMLAGKWRPDEQGGNLAEVWPEIHAQGLTRLGMEADGADLPGVLLVMQEMGRAACAAPLLATVLANGACGEASPGLDGRALAFSFAGHDGDGEAGSVILSDGHVSGTLRFVECMDIAQTLVVITDDHQLCCIDIAPDAVRFAPATGLARPALFDVTLRHAPADCIQLTAETVDALHRVARLALAARALGAAQKGFELVLDHAKVRRQFGQPIGQFQAIQHKLANSRMQLDGAQLQIDAAAAAAVQNRAAWPLAAHAAITYCAQSLRQIALETQHCFGAIGFAEEHDAPKLFRRIHADVARMGGAAGARAEFAHLLFDGEGDAYAAADAGGSDPASGLRSELRAWLADNWTEADKAASRATPFSERKWNLPFAQRLGAAGWTTLNWPVDAGGQARSPIEQLAYAEELLRAEAADGCVVAGSRLLAPEVIAHGNPDLQAALLPGLRAGTVSVCLGYSEPESGSDLASLKTRAVQAGNGYVINGQKIWTTDGHRATHMILAARTNPDPQVKHGGISLFVLPMDTPGITIRPTMAMYGHMFCNIFFDDVHIPASMRLGEENGGWRILANALASERVVMGAFASEVRNLAARMVLDLKLHGKGGDAVIRDRMAGLAAEVEVARQLSLRSIMMSGGAYTPLVESAMAKVCASEVSQRLTEAGIDMFGAACLLGEDAPGVPADGRIEQLLRTSIMMVVGGGTNEIQRNVIAQRGLGLPVQR